MLAQVSDKIMSNSPSAPMPSFPPLTLIVATTPSLGIGLRGSLPWPTLKADLAFFARVTKHPPPLSILPPTPNSEHGVRKAVNAVIMGRKTWESIPPKFRPLKGRVNVVISRDTGVIETLGRLDSSTIGSSTQTVGARSISEGIETLQAYYGGEDSPFELGRVFVIGGASIYDQTMKMGNCERILWTRIHKEYECDVHFPGQGILGGLGDAGEEGSRTWQQKSKEELREWCGEEGVGGVTMDGDVEFEVQMWERLRDRSTARNEQ